MDLVVDVGNFQAKAAFFEEDKIADLLVFQEGSLQAFCDKLAEHPVKRALIASVHREREGIIARCLHDKGIPFKQLDQMPLKIKLDVDEPEQLGQDRIANAYGALKKFPLNDAIVVDIGTAITFDLVAKEGRYLGGMIFPGFTLLAKSLSEYTDLLPNVVVVKPESPLGKTTKTHLQSGMYYGGLGAIERLIDELRRVSGSPGAVKVLATGGGVREDSEEKRAFVEDLKELVDGIDANLTLIGLHEILKEEGVAKHPQNIGD